MHWYSQLVNNYRYNCRLQTTPHLIIVLIFFLTFFCGGNHHLVGCLWETKSYCFVSSPGDPIHLLRNNTILIKHFNCVPPSASGEFFWVIKWTFVFSHVSQCRRYLINVFGNFHFLWRNDMKCKRHNSRGEGSHRCWFYCILRLLLFPIVMTIIIMCCNEQKTDISAD